MGTLEAVRALVKDRAGNDVVALGHWREIESQKTLCGRRLRHAAPGVEGEVTCKVCVRRSKLRDGRTT